MVLIFIKLFIFIYLGFSIFSDYSAYATCTETSNCGSDSGQASIFPDITTGEANYNTAHGYHSAGMDITTGDANTVLGYEAGKIINTGSYNTAVGSDSLSSLTVGNNNTAIGYNSGSSNSSGSGNIFIGYEAGPASGDVSNQLYIANSSSNTPLIHGDFSTNTVTINDDLVINGSFSGTNYSIDSNGNASGLGTVSSGTISSSGNISASGSFIIGNANIGESELEVIDDITAGTVSANKAIVVDNEKNISGFNTLSANTIKANTFEDSNGERFLYKDTANDIVHIGSNSMLFYDSSTYGKDIMASSTGHIQIGNSTSDTTTVMGDLIIQEPSASNHAATRSYADKVSLMAAALDTRLPLYGNKHALNLSSTSTNNEIAFGLNFVGIYDGLHLPLDFSLGSAFSGDYNMGKLSIGVSW